VERSGKIALAAGLLLAGVIVLGRFLDLEDPGEDPENLPASPLASATPGSALPEAPPEVNAPELESGSLAQDESVDSASAPGDAAIQADSGSPPDELNYEYRAVPTPTSAAADPINDWEGKFGKEERDDAWARPLEAQIRTSLEPEVDQGRFYISNVECRATLCEIRLLGRGSLQRAELERFESELYQLPWASNLSAALSSGVISRDSYESIWIFEKKAATPAR
jgi:hypothetical protein